MARSNDPRMITRPLLDVGALISAAEGACKSLARCTNFFNFEYSQSWLGWENWLTVDIVRRLNNKDVVRFGAYANGSKSDILIHSTPRIAVEIKVNFIDEAEIEKWAKNGAHRLPKRVENDLKKLTRAVRSAQRVMLVATCIENAQKNHDQYRSLVTPYLQKHYKAWTCSWISCSNILLLVLQR